MKPAAWSCPNKRSKKFHHSFDSDARERERKKGRRERGGVGTREQMYIYHASAFNS